MHTVISLRGVTWISLAGDTWTIVHVTWAFEKTCSLVYFIFVGLWM